MDPSEDIRVPGEDAAIARLEALTARAAQVARRPVPPPPGAPALPSKLRPSAATRADSPSGSMPAATLPAPTSTPEVAASATSNDAITQGPAASSDPVDPREQPTSDSAAVPAVPDVPAMAAANTDDEAPDVHEAHSTGPVLGVGPAPGMKAAHRFAAVNWDREEATLAAPSFEDEPVEDVPFGPLKAAERFGQVNWDRHVLGSGPSKAAPVDAIRTSSVADLMSAADW